MKTSWTTQNFPKFPEFWEEWKHCPKVLKSPTPSYESKAQTSMCIHIYAILSPHAMKISYFSFSQSSCRSTCSPPKGIMVQVLSCHHFKSQTVVSPSHEPVVVFAGGNHLFVATSQHSIEVYLLDGAKCTLVNTVKTVGIAWNGTFSIKGML